MKVSAVVVSRMDRPIGRVLDSIIPHVGDLTVVRGNRGVWERWEAAAAARCDVVYTQDDDAIVDVPAVLEAYRPGLVTCNMPANRRPEYPDGIALVGWGCVFDKNSMLWGNRQDQAPGFIGAFDAYLRWRFGMENYPHPRSDFDPLFLSECDRVFTGLSPLHLIDVPFESLPYAYATDRMGKREEHGNYMREIRRRIYAVREAQ